jgi:hypothetical protein
MRLVPIKEALTMVGETVPSIRGRITAVQKPIKSPENDADGKPKWGPFQKIDVQDNTGQITVKIWCHDEIPASAKGQEILVMAKDGQRGLCGCKAKEDEYRGKKSVILDVSDAGIVEVGCGQSNAPAQTSSQTAPAAQGQSQVAQQGNGAASSNGHSGNGHSNGNGSGGGLPEVRKRINKMANLYLHCLAAAEYVQEQWETSKGKSGDRVMPAEQFQACVSSIFIEACRSQLVFETPGGAFNKSE